MYSRIAWIVFQRAVFFLQTGDKQQVNGTVDDNQRLRFSPVDNDVKNNKNKRLMKYYCCEQACGRLW
jgi:hypothetical protein